MYRTFYQLSEKPFNATPDPRFLFFTPEHREALSSMLYVIRERSGFAAITGEVGTGKTTLVHCLLNGLAGRAQTSFIFHTYVSFVQLLQKIFLDLGIPVITDNKVFLLDQLNRYLVERLAGDETVAVIIDEAHNLSNGVLEELRMLSNLETPQTKLLQILLVGQPELDEKLNSHELRQLKQRIAIRSRIAPLSAQESYAYIEHRLSVAGLDKPTIFTKEALDIIVKEANGVPRRLNVLCDNALIAGFGYQKNPVTASIAREVVTDFAAKQGRPPVRKWKVAALVGVAVFLAIVVAFSLSPYRHGAVQMLGDAGLGQATKPEPLRPPVSGPPGEPQLGVPVPEVPPSSEPKGAVEPPGAAEPRAAIKPESAIQPTEIVVQERGGAAASYTTRVVKRGETLSDLVREVYRISPKSALEPSLIDLVKQHNPAIIDSNLILAGSVIRFPELPKEK